MGTWKSGSLRHKSIKRPRFNLGTHAAWYLCTRRCTLIRCVMEAMQAWSGGEMWFMWLSTEKKEGVWWVWGEAMQGFSFSCFFSPELKTALLSDARERQTKVISPNIQHWAVKRCVLSIWLYMIWYARELPTSYRNTIYLWSGGASGFYGSVQVDGSFWIQITALTHLSHQHCTGADADADAWPGIGSHFHHLEAN